MSSFILAELGLKMATEPVRLGTGVRITTQIPWPACEPSRLVHHVALVYCHLRCQVDPKRRTGITEQSRVEFEKFLVQEPIAQDVIQRIGVAKLKWDNGKGCVRRQ